MRLGRLRIAGIVAATALVLIPAGCGTDSPSARASPVGSWGSEVQGQPNLTLAKDGTLSGSDGCNRLIGGWKQDGDAVTLTIVGTTKMMCTGVDTWLSKAASASIDGTTMTVEDTAGTTIGTLEKDKA
ncbi:MAG: META domain-containing protein [Micrococcales bacterium]|nr:META domain-containing protein [Micrococcales bacterium]